MKLHRGQNRESVTNGEGKACVRDAASKAQKAKNALAAQTSQKVLDQALANAEKPKAKAKPKATTKAAAAPAEPSKSAKKKATKIANAAAAAVQENP